MTSRRQLWTGQSERERERTLRRGVVRRETVTLSEGRCCLRVAILAIITWEWVCIKYKYLHRMHIISLHVYVALYFPQQKERKELIQQQQLNTDVCLKLKIETKNATTLPHCSLRNWRRQRRRRRRREREWQRRSILVLHRRDDCKV